MDAKITKKRLGEFLSYEWLKIVAIAVALIVAWSILFSCTTAKLTHDQVFTIINYTGTSTGTGFYDYSSALTGKGVFSYEVNEVNTLDITVENGTMSGTLLETRLTTGQGDVMFVADTEWTGKEYYVTDDNGEKIPLTDGSGDYQKATATYLHAFLHSSYHYTALPLDDVTTVQGTSPYETKGLLTYVREYLDDYFTLSGDKFVEDEAFDDSDWQVMEGLFRARVARTQDKRFRNESLIQSGLQQEKARLIKYRDAYNTFMDNMSTGKIQPTISKVVFDDEYGNKLVMRGAYSLNICPNDINMPTFKQTVAYKNGENVYTAQNINVVFLNVGSSQPEFFCEKILFVNDLVDTHYVATTPNP